MPDRNAAISEALREAGANALPDGPRTWLFGRIAVHGFDVDHVCLGGLRPAGLGACGLGDVGEAAGRRLARFASIGEAAEALVDVATRAGSTPDAPAPDIESIGDVDESGQWHAYWRFGPYIDQRGRNRVGWHKHPKGTCEVQGPDASRVFRDDETPPGALGVGWILFLGPGDEAKKIYAKLRADWAAFQQAGVGEGKLAFLKPDLDAWSKFSRAWEISDWTPSFSHPDLGEPSELGARLDAQIAVANRVRAEIVQAQTGKFTAPIDVPQDPGRKEHASAMDRFAGWVDARVKEHPSLDWLTDPKSPPVEAGKRIIGAMAAGIVVLVTMAVALTHRPPVVVKVEGKR